jgi:hypothetical protein
MLRASRFCLRRLTCICSQPAPGRLPGKSAPVVRRSAFPTLIEPLAQTLVIQPAQAARIYERQMNAS